MSIWLMVYSQPCYKTAVFNVEEISHLLCQLQCSDYLMIFWGTQTVPNMHKHLNWWWLACCHSDTLYHLCDGLKGNMKVVQYCIAINQGDIFYCFLKAIKDENTILYQQAYYVSGFISILGCLLWTSTCLVMSSTQDTVPMPFTIIIFVRSSLVRSFLFGDKHAGAPASA
jgi:hypothetical protein